MPLEAFVERMYEGMREGSDQFAVGHGEDLMRGWEAERTRLFLAQVVMID